MSRREPQRTRAWIWVGLVVVSAWALALRVGALSRLLPVHPEPDASLVWTYRALCGDTTAEATRHFGVYPIFLPAGLAAVGEREVLASAEARATLEDHLAAASAPYVRLRRLGAWLAFLLVPISFFLGRRWLADAWALFAAALLATAMLHVAHASIAKPHAAAATFVWLTLLCALRFQERPSVARALAGAGAGLAAIGTLHTGLFVLPAMVASAWLADPSSRAARWSGWLAPAASLAGGLCFMPGFVSFEPHEIRLGHGHPILFTFLNGRGLGVWTELFWEHDPVLALLAASGGLVLLGALVTRRKALVARDPALVLVAFALPYALLISLDARVVDRYLLPLYPLFALCGALASQALAARVPGRAWPVAFGAALLAFPAWASARFTWLGRQPTTYVQLARWIEAQPDALHSRVLLSLWITPPLCPTPAALAQQLATSSGRSQPWFHYLGGLASLPAHVTQYDLRTLPPELYLRDPPPCEEDVLAELAALQPQWIVLEDTPRVLTFPGAKAIHETVRAHAERVAVFSGYASSYRGPIDYQGARDLALRALDATALGPRLEVYLWHRP